MTVLLSSKTHAVGEAELLMASLCSEAVPSLMMASTTPIRGLLIAVITLALICVGALDGPLWYSHKLPLVSRRSTSKVPLTDVPSVICCTPEEARTVVELFFCVHSSAAPVVKSKPACPWGPALTEATPLE